MRLKKGIYLIIIIKHLFNFAAFHDSIKIGELLIEKGAYINVKDIIYYYIIILFIIIMI